MFGNILLCVECFIALRFHITSYSRDHRKQHTLGFCFNAAPAATQQRVVPSTTPKNQLIKCSPIQALSSALESALRAFIAPLLPHRLPSVSLLLPTSQRATLIDITIDKLPSDDLATPRKGHFLPALLFPVVKRFHIVKVASLSIATIGNVFFTATQEGGGTSRRPAPTTGRCLGLVVHHAPHAAQRRQGQPSTSVIMRL